MLRKLLCSLTLLCAAQAAHAGVMYTWHETKPSASMPPGLRLELEFSEAAVAAGSVNLDFMDLCFAPDDCLISSQTELLSLRYWFDRGVHGVNRIEYVAGEPPSYFHMMMEMKVDFMPGGFLSGWMKVNDGNSDFEMGSDGRRFHVITANSDEPDGCGFEYPECEGAQGFIRADVATEVPEPASGAVFGVGLAAAALARRRRGLRQAAR